MSESDLLSRRDRAVMWTAAGLASVGSFVLIAKISLIVEGSLLTTEQYELYAGPAIEELLKPLGLVLLAVLFPSQIGSRGVGYLGGFSMGAIFGTLENLIVYSFAGIRWVTPLLHATETGLVGLGIYYVLARGKRGVPLLALLFLTASGMHVVWNHQVLVPLVGAVIGGLGVGAVVGSVLSIRR